MVKKNIVFVSFDNEYVATIEYKFAKLIKDKATVEFVTEQSVFNSLMNIPKKIDVLIIPSSINIAHPELFSKTKIYYLTENQADESNPVYIYKYNSVKSIVQKIDANLIADVRDADNKGTKVVGVFSVAGGTGKTLTALALAHKIKQKGKRVIYVSTVPHQDFEYYINSGNVLGTAFCYQCTINIKNALKLIQGEICNIGFDYLPAFKNLPVSYQMKFDAYAQIVKSIKESNMYDYIIVELSSELQSEKLGFLKECDRAVVVTSQDRVAIGKLETFLGNMLDFNQNIVILCNRFKRNQFDYLSSSENLRRYEISEYIEEFTETLDLNMIKNSQLFDRTCISIE